MPVSSRPAPETLFSVIMPVYQGERYLEQALQSILNQPEELRNTLEVIVVDDGSTDQSPEILKQWKDKLPLVILTRNEGSNWMSATNKGLEIAQGTWISFLHQDDEWDHKRLPALQAAIQENPGLHFFCHPVYMISPSGKRYGQWRPPLPTNQPLTTSSVLEKMVTQNTMGIPSPCFHRDLLAKEKALREDLWFLADWDFWLRLLFHTEKIYCLKQPLASFRIHPESQTMTQSDKESDLRAQFLEVHQRVAQHFAGTHPREQAARLNTEVTITLANYSHHLPGYPGRVLWGFLKLGPVGAWRFLKETRLWERLLPRWNLRKEVS